MTKPHPQVLTAPAAAPTMDRFGRRRWLYPDRRPGPHARRRQIIALILIVIYLSGPWLSWNGTPLLRLDVLDKKAFLLGQIFHLSDLGLIAPVMATLALLLFFATSLKGRIWCAYGCPQTVFVEWVIRPIEELTEGSAHHRRRMDTSAMTWGLRTRKILKHILFLVVAALVANTFLAFFFGPERIGQWMLSSPAEHPAAFGVMAAVMLGFYADLAWFREQFCAFLCPYARFQSVMMDQDTPVVSYDQSRGEPRGQDKNTKVSVRQHGDCIDCQLCVRVCPTGIDIRNGLQLECIMCARCMDACDTVMTNLKRPKGLIRIASQSELTRQQKTHFWRRPKVLAYGVALILLCGAAAVRVMTREDLSLTLMRAPGTTYTKMPDGRLGNMLILRATNNTSRSMILDLKIIAPTSAELLCNQCQTVIPASGELRATAIIAFARSAVNTPLIIANHATGDEARMLLLGP
jgi:cytochrome c oxidase accessory protein FixG